MIIVGDICFWCRVEQYPNQYDQSTKWIASMLGPGQSGPLKTGAIGLKRVNGAHVS